MGLALTDAILSHKIAWSK